MMGRPYERFIWRETRPGTWQRDVDEPEEFYAAIAKLYDGSGRMFFAITGHVSLIVAMAEDESRVDTEMRLEIALQQGWLRLRYEQPTIASQVEYDPAAGRFTKTYHVCRDLVEQKAWINTSLKMICTGQTGSEWCNSDPPAPKLPTLFVITPPSSTIRNRDGILRRDLVLRSPHDTIDGIGTLHLLNRLITHVSTVYSETTPLKILLCDGSESANLSPPFRVAADIQPTLTPAQTSRLQEISARKTSRIGEGLEIEEVCIPYKQGAVVPGRHQRVEYTFSEEHTKQLLATCQASDVTVTHAFHAGIAIALRNVQQRKPASRRARYSTYLLRNERGHCVAPYNTAMHAATVYHSASSSSLAVDLTIPSLEDEDADGASKQKEFMKMLYIMRDFYRQSRDDTDHPALAPYLWASSTPALPEEVVRSRQPLPVPPPNPLPSVSISSMGKIDKIIAPSTGVFEIYSPWVTGEELRNGFGLFLGSFRGHLCLSAAFNDAWHNGDEAVGFLQRCGEIVFQGLGINSNRGRHSANIRSMNDAK